MDNGNKDANLKEKLRQALNSTFKVISDDFGEKDQFALYIGLGGRYLYNASGYRLSSTGHAGYDRISRYLYAPIGIRISNINSNRVIVFNLEYDYFIQGIQESKLSQAGSSYRDVTHSQDSGYGIKLTAGFFGVQKETYRYI